MNLILNFKLKDYSSLIQDYFKVGKILWELPTTPADTRQVAESLTRVKYERLRVLATRRLKQLRDQSAIDSLCAVWEATRHPDLATLIVERGWIASAPSKLRVLTALQAGKLQTLSWDEVLLTLARLHQQEQDLALARYAGEGLETFYEPDLYHALCNKWANLTPPVIENIAHWKGFILTHSAGLRIITALVSRRPELLFTAGESIVLPLLEAYRDPDQNIAEQAGIALRKLENAKAQELLCRLALESGNDLARQLALVLVLETGYHPRDQHQRALFYFLTEQWGKYEQLDFDQRLLGFVYEVGDDKLRQRIADSSRAAGRAELVKIMAGGRQGLRQRNMTNAEWAVALELLQKGQRWAEAWELAQYAPPVWSRKLLQELFQANWQPQLPAERDIYNTLTILAGDCETEYPPLGRQLKIQQKLEGHTKAVNTLAISPDGQILATAGQDGNLRLWQLPGGKLLSTIQEMVDVSDIQAGVTFSHPPKHIVKSLAFSPDGQILAYEDGWWNSKGKWEGRLRLLKLAQTPTVSTLHHHAEVTKHGSVAFHPDKQILASCGGEFILLWNLATGEIFKKLKAIGQGFSPWYGHPPFKVDSLAFSPEGDWLASGSTNGRIELWNLQDGRYLSTTINAGGYSIVFKNLAFNPDGKTLASANNYQHIKIWSIPEGWLLSTMQGHHQEIKTLAFSPDGLRLATGHREVVRLWGLPNFENAGKTAPTANSPVSPVKTAKGHRSTVNAMAFTPDGQQLVTAGEDGQVLIWSSRPAKLAHTPLPQANIKDLLFARQSQRDPALPKVERQWLAFIEALLGWQWQHEIEIEDFSDIRAAQFDIEF